MKRTRAVQALGLMGLAAFGLQPAAAADSGWYLGAGIGQSRAKINDSRITTDLQGQGLSVTSIQDDDRGVGWKLFGGYKFNKNFAVEGGYFNLGEFGYTANTNNGSQVATIKAQGANLDAVGILPITERFSALARAGLTYTSAKDTFANTGGVTAPSGSPSKTEGNYKLGLGVQYDLTKSLALRGEWERYRINDAVGNDGVAQMLTIGLVYVFGAEKAAPKAAAPAPAPQPVAKEAEPVLVVVPVVLTEQYCSILDIQFEINQKTVQREAEERIDKVGLFMKKYPKTTAVIEGHSDEVGNAADNMKLSERRAENVVTYLVDHSGIARSRLKSVGYGETRPLGDNKTEAGRRMNRRINAVIACATDIEGIAPVPERITMAMEMEFDTNSAEVRPQYREELRKVANFIKAHPGVTATVEGHTSNLAGNLKTNRADAMQLSQRRAQNVVNTMVTDFGVERTRLSAAGFGETRRFAYNTSAEGQQENRRVNIILDFPKAAAPRT